MRLLLCAGLLTIAACIPSGGSDQGLGAPTSQSNHPPFPITNGAHAYSCETCHTSDETFTQFTCISCHTHEQTICDALHVGIADYAYTDDACLACHTDNLDHVYAHTGITDGCAACHAVDTPFAALPFPGFVHLAITEDCSICHTWPGSGAPTSPNWLGALGMPDTIEVGGFPIPQPPAASPTVQTGIPSLPHPATSDLCSACHIDGGGKNAVGYDHASPLINDNCSSCHEAGSDLVGTVWNGATSQANGAGDTRPSSLTAARASYHGKDARNVTYPKHFFPVDCNECHVAPPGNGLVTTGTAYRTAWAFPHTTKAMTNPSTCVMCHTSEIPH